MIITVDLVRSVLHAAVADVVADQLAGDAVRGVAALELRRVVAAGHVLHTPVQWFPLCSTLCYLYLSPSCLEALGPDSLVRQVEGELQHIGLGQDLPASVSVNSLQ